MMKFPLPVCAQKEPACVSNTPKSVYSVKLLTASDIIHTSSEKGGLSSGYVLQHLDMKLYLNGSDKLGFLGGALQNLQSLVTLGLGVRPPCSLLYNGYDLSVL